MKNPSSRKKQPGNIVLGKTFTLRLPSQMRSKLDELAESQYRSITNYVELVLLNHLKNLEGDKK